MGEQAQYLGSTYLPAVANLKGRFQGQKSELALRLAELGAKQRQDAQGIWQWEMEQDAAREAAAQAARAASAGSGGGGGFTFGGGTSTKTGQSAPQLSLRQTWQQQANQGDWNAQVALNYAGDDGNYDGPVNSQSEYLILKQLGITGNYFVPNTAGSTGGLNYGSSTGGLQIQGGGQAVKPLNTSSGLRRL